MFGPLSGKLRTGIDFFGSGNFASRRNVVNFIPGTNVTLTASDNQAQGRVDVTINASGGGSSLPVSDATIIVQGSGDATKQLRFEVDGFTTGTTRVLTPQDASYTIAGLEIANVFTLGPQTLK